MSLLERIDAGKIVVSPDISRGTFISPDELETALGYSRDDKAYQLLLLRLRSQFHRDTTAEGDPKAMKVEGYGLRVLTDEEGASYMPDLAGRFLRCASRAIRLGLDTVRPDHLTERTRARWDAYAAKASQIERSTTAHALEMEKLQALQDGGQD